MYKPTEPERHNYMTHGVPTELGQTLLAAARSGSANASVGADMARRFREVPPDAESRD